MPSVLWPPGVRPGPGTLPGPGSSLPAPSPNYRCPISTEPRPTPAARPPNRRRPSCCRTVCIGQVVRVDQATRCRRGQGGCRYRRQHRRRRSYGRRPGQAVPFRLVPSGPRSPFGPVAFGPIPFGPVAFGPVPFGPAPFGPVPFGSPTVAGPTGSVVGPSGSAATPGSATNGTVMLATDAAAAVAGPSVEGV